MKVEIMKCGYRRLLVGLLSLSLAVVSAGALAETGLAAAGQVVDSYLTSLASGDTQRLVEVLDEGMKTRNRQLTLDPEYYGEFLRTHYAGVVMTVESMEARGAFVDARVRFDYPASSTTVITFVLVQIDGDWKIGDEVF